MLKQPPSLTLDGIVQQEQVIPLVDDHLEHTVEFMIVRQG